jgi:hypothetical protein
MVSDAVISTPDCFLIPTLDGAAKISAEVAAKKVDNNYLWTLVQRAVQDIFSS